MAELKPILKNNQNTLLPPFWFHTQNRYSTSQNRVFVFTVKIGAFEIVLSQLCLSHQRAEIHLDISVDMSFPVSH